MANTSVTITSYSVLLRQLKKEIAEGLVRSQIAYEKEKIITYWKVGKSISSYLSENNRADYGKKLYQKLSKDLSISERILYQTSKFYNAYPNFKPAKNLKWSHYRLLISIRDGKKRSLLESKASSDNWSKRTLEGCVSESKEVKIPRRPADSLGMTSCRARKKGKLSIPQGKLYTYRVFKDECAEDFLIDLGFNIYREINLRDYPSPHLSPKGRGVSGRLGFIETVKTGSEYKTVPSKATEKYLYTFKAYPKKIIDGDTLWVMIDCGFKTWAKQKIRLRGIDAPEVETPEGKKALSFVTKALKGLPFIVIKCQKRDKYDRYLSDVFYLRGETDPTLVFKNGTFLNQELLDNGLAQQLV